MEKYQINKGKKVMFIKRTVLRNFSNNEIVIPIFKIKKIRSKMKSSKINDAFENLIKNKLKSREIAT